MRKLALFITAVCVLFSIKYNDGLRVEVFMIKDVIFLVIFSNRTWKTCSCCPSFPPVLFRPSFPHVRQRTPRSLHIIYATSIMAFFPIKLSFIFFIYLTVFVSVYEVIPEAPVVQSMNNNISLDKSVSMHCTMSTRESNCAIHWIENCSADISTF